MILIKPLVEELVTDFASSLINPPLTVPVTSGLKAQLTTIQEGKAKSELVNVNGIEQTADWFDITGNNNSGSQGTTNLQPIYTLNVLNGLPALVFDNVDDFMSIPEIVNAITTAFTLFIVAKFSGGTLLTIANNKAALRVAGGSLLTSNISSTNFSGDVITFAPQIYVLRTEEIAAPSFNQRLYADGVLGKSETRTIFAGNGAWFIGGNTNASIGEFLFYDRALSDPERTAVDNYLGKKFKIALP